MLRLVKKSHVQLRRLSSGAYPAAWDKLAKKELGGKPGSSLEWVTPEGITLKPLYTNPASTNIDTEEAPGVYPFKRGPYATMYTAKP